MKVQKGSVRWGTRDDTKAGVLLILVSGLLVLLGSLAILFVKVADLHRRSAAAQGTAYIVRNMLRTARAD